MADRGGEAHQPKLWRFEAPDEAAMLGFAAAQAAWLEPGDFVGLTGDLGRGQDDLRARTDSGPRGSAGSRSAEPDLHVDAGL